MLRADKLQNCEPHRFHHAPDFAVFAFGQHDIEPGVLAAIFAPPHAEGMCQIAALHFHAGTQLGNHFVAE